MIGRALIATIFVLAVGAAGCGLTDVGRPLSVSITADQMTADVGDTINFSVSGTGTFLSGFTVDYDGDGEEDDQFPDVPPLGSQTASTTFRHAYGSEGTFRAVANVFDSSGELSDTVEVVIEGE